MVSPGDKVVQDMSCHNNKENVLCVSGGEIFTLGLMFLVFLVILILNFSNKEKKQIL